MRILFVQAGLGAGGAEKVVRLLAEHYAELGHDVHVLALNADPAKAYFKYPDNVTIHAAHRKPGRATRYLGRLADILWLKRKFRQLKPDVVLSFLTKVNCLAAIATTFLKVPLVIAERNNPERQLRSSVWRACNRRAARRADHIVMQTAQAAESLEPAVRGKATVIANPCPVKPDGSEPPETGNHFIAVGRLDAQKGFDLLFAAFREVLNAQPDARLTIFGDGPERDALEALRGSLSLNDAVDLPGSTPTPGAWQGAGNIFVLSSRFEGFPNVLLEAMAAGYPVIAFDCPWGPSEIITDKIDGVLVPDQDASELARQMTALAGDAEQQRRLAAAAQSVTERYDVPSILAKWDRIVSESGKAS